MSTFKNTPGPWRYCKTNEGHMIAGAKPGYLAEVRDCGSGDVEANARLIAAAPELLEALTEIVAAADGDGWKQLDATFARPRAAIAKATQEPQA